MMRNELLNILHRGLTEMGQSLDRQTESNLIYYINLIEKYNRMYKLTSIRDIDIMVTRHLLDSLSILPYIEGHSILDVGTGAGLPGIPLAISMPDKQFVVLDSSQQKTNFLRHVCYQMRLRNVRIVHQRVEEYQATPLFDTVISRAFGTLRDFVTLSQHLVNPNGQLLAMKGVYPLTELQDIPKQFKLLDVYPLQVPNLNAERHVVDLSYEPQTEKEFIEA